MICALNGKKITSAAIFVATVTGIQSQNRPDIVLIMTD